MNDDIKLFHRELGGINTTLKSIERELTLSIERSDKMLSEARKNIDSLKNDQAELGSKFDQHLSNYKHEHASLVNTDLEIEKQVGENLKAYEKMRKFVTLIAFLLGILLFSSGFVSYDMITKLLAGAL